MKFFVLVSLLGVAAAHDFTTCPGHQDQMGITAVNVFPDPAQVGKNIEVTVSGTTTVTVNPGAAVHLAVKLFDVTITHLNLDFCKDLGVVCPLASGTAWQGKITYLVPAQAPGGLTVDLELQLNNSDKSDIGCISLKEKLVKPSHLEAEFKATPAQTDQFLFTKWAKQFQKNYEVDEVFHRFNIFKANYAKITSHNAAKLSWTMGLNEFADLTAEEFGATYKGLLPQRSAYLRSQNEPVFPKNLKLASSIDWVAKGAVTAVKNQGQCGSCWAFSTTGSIEGAHEIATGKLVSLSEQQLVDCAGSSGNQGCNGGLMDNGFEWVIKNGLCEEDYYPYKAQDGSCQKSKCTAATHITGYKDIKQGDEDSLMTAVNLTPVSIAIEADQSSFQFYSGGVLDGTCGKQLDHGVLLVGYGTDSGKDYWKIKNSWGASWGESGYIRVIRGKDICGLADSASYPTGASLEEPAL
jgi:hypothetical protein